MAKETGTTLFLGTDHQYVFHIKNLAEDTSIDIGGWALSWMVKLATSDADAAALVTKTGSSGIAIAGTFNSAPSTNAQRATVTVEDTDTATLTAGVRVWELKRTDAGYETVLAYGPITFRRGVHR